jgi:hypothetical protein
MVMKPALNEPMPEGERAVFATGLLTNLSETGSNSR